MDNNKYVVFKISGISNSSGDSFVFEKNAVYQMKDDKYIAKIIVAADIGSVTFYLHDSLKFTNEMSPQILDYLCSFLRCMMVGLLKNSSRYPNVCLQPEVHLSEVHFSENNEIKSEFRERFTLHDSVLIRMKLGDGDSILRKWIDDTGLSDYVSRADKYDILFSLLKEDNAVQKYMALYAYLSVLVKALCSESHERQRDVVRYVKDNCSRVGLEVSLTPSSRPGAKKTDEEDQFTRLRNKIGHPSGANKVEVNENDVNGLAAIICCAIEDLTDGSEMEGF